MSLPLVHTSSCLSHKDVLKPRGVQGPTPFRPSIQLEPKVIQLLLELPLCGRGLALRDKVLVHMLHHSSGTYGVDEAMVLSNLLRRDSLILPYRMQKKQTVEQKEGGSEEESAHISRSEMEQPANQH